MRSEIQAIPYKLESKLVPKYITAQQEPVLSLFYPAEQWMGEDLRALEKYFGQRVANYPYKQNNMLSFCRMSAAPAKCVRDFIQIIKKQMVS